MEYDIYPVVPHGNKHFQGVVEIRFSDGWRSLRMVWADKDEETALARGPLLVSIVKNLGDNTSHVGMLRALSGGHVNVSCIFKENLVKDDWTRRRSL